MIAVITSTPITSCLATNNRQMWVFSIQLFGKCDKEVR